MSWAIQLDNWIPIIFPLESHQEVYIYMSWDFSYNIPMKSPFNSHDSHYSPIKYIINFPLDSHDFHIFTSKIKKKSQCFYSVLQFHELFKGVVHFQFGYIYPPYWVFIPPYPILKCSWDFPSKHPLKRGDWAQVASTGAWLGNLLTSNQVIETEPWGVVWWRPGLC